MINAQNKCMRKMEGVGKMIGTKAVAQIAIVVHDIEKTGQAFADLFGIEKPPAVHSGATEIAKAHYKGEPTDATCLMMFFDLENVQLELIQPDEKPSVWREVLDEQGEGIHHIAFQVKGAKERMAEFAAKGYETTMYGNYGDASGMYAYLDTVKDLKIVVELLESF